LKSLLDGFVGVAARPTYRLEVWKTRAPKLAKLGPGAEYVYLTKINHRGEIGERSIGIPATDVPELMTILARIVEKK
jgi:hypothetical protein